MWINMDNTMCPRSSDPFYIVTYHIKWVTTPWTYSTIYTRVVFLCEGFSLLCVRHVFNMLLEREKSCEKIESLCFSILEKIIRYFKIQSIQILLDHISTVI